MHAQQAAVRGTNTSPKHIQDIALGLRSIGSGQWLSHLPGMQEASHCDMIWDGIGNSHSPKPEAQQTP